MRKLLTLGLAGVLLAIPFATSAQNAFTTRSVNIRGGPDLSYPAVAALPPGAPVQVMGCLDDWSWCDVVFGDDRGWIYAPYLSYVYEGARVPFYTYAPSFGIPIIAFSLGSYWDRYYRGRSWYGRRDYWEHRAPPPHMRPSGPPPRATAPAFGGRPEMQGGRPPAGTPAFTGNRGTPPAVDNRPSREGRVPSTDRPGAKGAPGGGAVPSTAQPSQQMRRASPTQQGSPAPAARVGTQQGSPAPAARVGTQQGGVPPAGRVGTQQGSPPPAGRVGTQQGSPLPAGRVGTQQGGPPPGAGAPHGAEKSAPQGDKSRSKEHEGAK